MKLTKRTEKTIQDEIRRYLRSLGAKVVRVNSGGLRVADRYVRFNSEDGCSDLVVCLRGRFVAVETKTPKTMPKARSRTPLSHATIKRIIRETQQRQFLDDVIAAGGLGFFAASVEDVQEALRREGVI